MNLVGQHVGNYVVVRELGAGGMGTVYLAEHPAIQRKVAIKVLHDEHATDPETVARFFQEARAAAQIGEEHIIEVIDFGEVLIGDRKVVYLMMELLDGSSLGKRLEHGPMSPAEVEHVALQICHALAQSHAKGIIHRDLKPENIYLCPRQSDPMFVKVLDFGIAKLTGPATTSARTRIGVVLGTPAYMSPEQCQGKGKIDGRSDIYALGVLLYEMLTGKLPFEGTFGELLSAHLTAIPNPPSSRRAAIPPEWDAIVMHCLEKEPENRFATMDDLAAAIRKPAEHAMAYREMVAARAARPRKTAVLDVDADRSATTSPGTTKPAGAHTTPVPANVGYAKTVEADLALRRTASVTPYDTPPGIVITPPRESHGHGAAMWLLGVGVAVLTAVLVFAGAALFRREAPTTPTPVATPATQPAPRGAPAPTPAPPARPTPVTPAPAVTAPATPTIVTPPVAAIDAGAAVPVAVRITLESDPSGARVSGKDGDREITGTTPLVIELTPDATPLEVTLTAQGRQPVKRTLSPRSDTEVLVVLPATKAAPRTPAKKPRTSDDLMRPE